MNIRARRMLPVVAVGAAGVCATSLTYAINPTDMSLFPPCPLNAIFGIDCPLCGGMRGTHALLNGDLAGAMDYNVALLLILPLVAAAFLWWAVRRWRGDHAEEVRVRWRGMNWIVVSALFALVLFGVVRNFVPYLGSGGAL